MAVLKKIEYFISNTSESTTQEAIEKIKTELNRKQNLASNKISDTEFKNLYFSGFFDPRSLKQYLIFSEQTKTQGGLSSEVYELDNNGTNIDETALQNLIANSPALNDFVTKTELETQINTKVNEIINSDLVTMEFINTL